MKRLFWLLVAVMGAHGSLSAAADLAGRYSSVEDPALKLAIGADHRVRTNITLSGQLSGETVPILFPHELRFDDLTGSYRTTGYFSINVYLHGVVQNCHFPITFELTPDPQFENIDGTLIYPDRAYLDSWGGCHSIGTIRDPYGFRREP